MRKQGEVPAQSEVWTLQERVGGFANPQLLNSASFSGQGDVVVTSQARQGSESLCAETVPLHLYWAVKGLLE